MLRRTALAAAPPKGNLFQRITSPDWLGINWMKVTWMAPYSNVYPVTMTAGPLARYWSNFVGFGNFNNRMTRNSARACALFGPTAVLGFIMAFQTDWYQLWKVAYYLPGWSLPDWAEAKYSEEMRLASWEKPGVYAKHHIGGQISIPGSERLITGE